MTGREMSTAYAEPEKQPEGEVLIEADDLTAPGLDGVSLSLHAGEILGVGGLEGQGQRELFGALFGLTPSGAGTPDPRKGVRLHSPRDAIHAGIAFIPQDRKAEGLLLPMTVRENLTLPILSRLAAAGVIRPAGERKAAEGMIERLSIDARRPGQPVGTLSGGNQQKVLLGRWLSGRLADPACCTTSRAVSTSPRSRTSTSCHQARGRRSRDPVLLLGHRGDRPPLPPRARPARGRRCR